MKNLFVMCARDTCEDWRMTLDVAAALTDGGDACTLGVGHNVGREGDGDGSGEGVVGLQVHQNCHVDLFGHALGLENQLIE